MYDPHVWARVDHNEFNVDHHSWKRRQEALSTWFRRSANMPLELSFTVINGYERDDLTLEEIILFLIGNQSRWKAVTIECYCTIKSEGTTFELARMPLLETLSLTFPESSDADSRAVQRRRK